MVIVSRIGSGVVSDSAEVGVFESTVVEGAGILTMIKLLVPKAFDSVTTLVNPTELPVWVCTGRRVSGTLVISWSAVDSSSNSTSISNGSVRHSHFSEPFRIDNVGSQSSIRGSSNNCCIIRRRCNSNRRQSMSRHIDNGMSSSIVFVTVLVNPTLPPVSVLVVSTG